VLTARLFSLLAAAAQLPILTRLLAPDEYAFFAAVTAAAVYVSLVSGDPVTLAFRRFPGSSSERDNYGYAQRRILGTFLLVGALLILFGMVVGRPDVGIAAVGWGAGLAGMRFVSTAWLMWQRPWRYAINLMVSTGARTIILVSGVISGFGVYEAVAVSGIASFAVAFLMGPRGWRQRSLSRPWPKYTGVSFAAGSLGTTVMQNFDRMVLPSISDATRAGQYAVMNQGAALTVGAAFGMVQTVLFPRVLRLWEGGGQEEAMRYTRIWLDRIAASTVVLLLIVALWGNEIMAPVVGGEYADAKLLYPLIAAVGLYSIGQQLSWVKQLQLDTKTIPRVALLASMLNLTALALFVPIWGVAGAALANVLGFSIYALGMQRGTRFGFPTVVLVASLTIAGVAFPFVPGRGIEVGIAAALAGVVGCAVLGNKWRVARSVNAESLAEMKNS
jgi:O-antigen/teichoic acid export membrane protein